jgi:hypothetical protein
VEEEDDIVVVVVVAAGIFFSPLAFPSLLGRQVKANAWGRREKNAGGRGSGCKREILAKSVL